MPTEIFKPLLNKSLVELDISDDRVLFRTLDGYVGAFYHIRDCCESVWLEDIEGNLKDLLHSPITLAEEVTEHNNDEEFQSTTWTFYRFQTAKGFVTMRWCGQSSGYYSERVDFSMYRPHYPSDIARLEEEF